MTFFSDWTHTGNTAERIGDSASFQSADTARPGDSQLAQISVRSSTAAHGESRRDTARPRPHSV